MESKASRVPPAYNMTGSLALQRELLSVVYVFIHDVVIMTGHISDKCFAGLPLYPLFHLCFMALRKLRKIIPIFAKAYCYPSLRKRNSLNESYTYVYKITIFTLLHTI